MARVFNPPDMTLVFRPLEDPASPWVFVGDHWYVNTVMMYRVFAGQRTDLASVPRIARLWCNPNGSWQRAAAFHDAAYRRRDCTRFQADAMFRAIMEHDGVPWARVLLMYYAVRFFGGWAWRRVGVRLKAWLRDQWSPYRRTLGR